MNLYENISSPIPIFDKSIVSTILSPIVIETNRKYGTEFIEELIQENKKKHEIILNWAHTLAELRNSGEFKEPINRICGTICTELRRLHQTEGQIAYVRKILNEFPEFKDEKHDGSDNWGQDQNQNETDNFIGSESTYYNYNPDSVFEDFDELAKRNLSETDIALMSPAQRQIYFEKKEDLVKEKKKRISNFSHDLQTLKDKFGVKTGLEKISAQLPPSEYQGFNDLSEMCSRIAKRYHNIGDHFDELAQESKNFKPSPEVATKSIKHLNMWLNKQKLFENFIAVNLQYVRNILNPIKDRKYAADLQGWFKLAWDDVVNFGAHGSGKKNAIGTGEILAKMGKEPNTVEVFELGREVTREQVGDRTAARILQYAYNMILHDELQKSIGNWTSNTTCYEDVMDLDDLVKAARKKELMSR